MWEHGKRYWVSWYDTALKRQFKIEYNGEHIIPALRELNFCEHMINKKVEEIKEDE